MKKTLLFLLLTALPVSHAQPAETSLHDAGEAGFEMADRIVATVNDRVITERDVGARIALTLRQLGLAHIPDGGKAQLIRRTLSELIDEEVKTTYAVSRGIQISDEALLNAIRTIEQRNGLTAGGYIKLVEGLETEARKKLRAEVRWRQTIQRFTAPNITVPKREVDQLLENLLKNQNQTEWELGQIFLPESAERSEGETQKLLQEIQAKLEAGEEFSSVARTYSEDDAARRGGNIGWFTAGETLPEIEAIVTDLELNTTSAPVRTALGWHIVQVLQRKNVERVVEKSTTHCQIVEVILPTADKKAQRKLSKILSKAGTVQEVENALASSKINATLGQTDWQELSAFTPEKQALLFTPQGKKVQVETAEDGSITLWKHIATREENSEQIESIRARIEERLTQQRVQLAEQRLIRELKDQYFVDIRVE